MTDRQDGSPTTSNDERRPRIVLADDHPAVLVAFARLLQQSCDVVASVSNGTDAIQAVTTLKPDVLVVDLMMPDVDGLEVCRRVIQLVPETDVVIVTAFDDAQVREIALRDGATAFVAKSVASERLEDTVLKIFARKPRPSTPRNVTDSVRQG
jgi:DNA-binding NarL/FixJ family response regulator